MDPHEFKQKLSEYSEWRLACEDGECNNTQSIEIVKLRHQPSTCQHCGLVTDQQICVEKKLYFAHEQKHWRQRCMTCNKCQSPYTGRFDLTGTEASREWTSLLRSSKMMLKTKYNLKKLALISETKYHSGDT
jgi:transcription initiation factor TFIIIB Brf1 subunit/transcription initiation factor TFIIB